MVLPSTPPTLLVSTSGTTLSLATLAGRTLRLEACFSQVPELAMTFSQIDDKILYVSLSTNEP